MSPLRSGAQRLSAVAMETAEQQQVGYRCRPGEGRGIPVTLRRSPLTSGRL